MLIQDNDSDWTEVPFKAKEIDLGSGLAVKITKMRVDGSDKADVNLGIELDVEIAGNTRRTIRFVGSERFSVIFQPERHVIESNKEASRVKVAFALEMISQRVSVMVSRFEEK